MSDNRERLKLIRPEGELMAIALGYDRLTPEAAALTFPSQAASIAPRRPRRVGLVELLGTLYKSAMVEARYEINELAANPDVGEIIVRVDSPGGSISGTSDLADAIARAARVKPVHAFIEDMGCSAAYWAVSGASKIYCNATAASGSIGVFTLVSDSSRMFQQLGIDRILIRSGKVKGAGVEGAKLSEDDIAAIQHRVDSVAAVFMAAVAKGRRMSVERVQDLADGRVFVGRQAVEAGLVDGVSNFEALFAEVIERNYERYLDLRGEAAAAKFDELVCERFRCDDPAGPGDGGRQVVAGRYPELFIEAERFEREQAKHQEAEYRRQIYSRPGTML